jgi:general nucleoside transport system ATP-binding protein
MNPPASSAHDRPMLEMRGISKRYGAVRANENIDLTIPAGRIVGLLGENGSGKSTLMKVLFGIVKADGGTIRFKDRPLTNHIPRDAIDAGIGMIHQHFMLVDAMTVVENVMLGWGRAGHWLRRLAISQEIRATSATYGLGLEPEAIISDLPFGQRQRVEIVKALLRGADLLILDEPTSNLSPPEVEGLLSVIRRIAKEGRSIVFISHKLKEVFEVCDEVVVLRDGRVSGRTLIVNATPSELARLMVGRDISAPPTRTICAAGAEILAVRELTLRDASGLERLSQISFSLREGEILALAGVDGNGQVELAETLAGIRSPSSGTVTLDQRDITKASVLDRLTAGLAYIPVDRSTTSLVPGMTIEENLGLRDFNRPPWRRGPWLNHAGFRTQAVSKIGKFRIVAAGPDAPVQTLSGGNQQKVVVAREVGRNPRVLIAAQPTWGLDPGAARFVIEQVLDLRNNGGTVLYISSELEEILMLGDRIGVLSKGRLLRVVPRDEADLVELGLLMAGSKPFVPLQEASRV